MAGLGALGFNPAMLMDAAKFCRSTLSRLLATAGGGLSASEEATIGVFMDAILSAMVEPVFTGSIGCGRAEDADGEATGGLLLSALAFIRAIFSATDTLGAEDSVLILSLFALEVSTDSLSVSGGEDGVGLANVLATGTGF